MVAGNKPLTSYAKYPQASSGFTVEQKSGVCAACGGFGPYRFEEIITDKLATEWKLTKKEQHAFSARESMFCPFCGCSYRLRALARAISLYVVPGNNLSLQELIEHGYFKDVKVAEINSCGVLHEILKKIPGLAYSEYDSHDPRVPSEDLTALSYQGQLFDLVLTSDTLEHVPDPALALSEISRVLKSTGAHIFTIPLRLDKPTVQRAVLDNSRTVHKLPPSFHGSGEPDYLVWNEFGEDFLLRINPIFNDVSTYFMNTLNIKDPSMVVVASHKRSQNTDTKVSFEITLNENRQLEQVNTLVNKLRLTEKHARNVEDINASFEEYLDGLHARLATIESELTRLHKPLIFRAASTIKRGFKYILSKLFG